MASQGGDHGDLQRAFLRVLAGQRSVGGPVLNLHLVRLGDGAEALIAGDQSGSVWPLGRVVNSPRDIVDALVSWSSTWEEATGYPPVLVGDGSFKQIAHRKGAPSIVRPHTTSAEAAAHRASHERLDAALSALAENTLGLPSEDLAIGLLAISLLRVWAHWLRQFGDSSVPYLLDQFIRRPGWISVRPDSTVIELASRPLDIVVQMSGYATEIEGVPWLGGRHIQYTMHS